MSATPRTVAIVGAGFCGTMLAVNLLRHGAVPGTRIILIERAEFARGRAYGRQRYPYLLNVPAGRMSASAENPDEFLEFARRSRSTATAADFLPRELYGAYLESLLLAAERAPGATVMLQRVRGLAIALERGHRRAGFRILMADGQRLDADEVVLATGNPAPAALPATAGLDPARYIADPWQSPPRFRHSESVLVVGTGLTMADVILAGTAGSAGPGRRMQIHAISRRGLLPAAQGPAHGAAVHELPLRPETDCQSLVQLSREVRRAARELMDRGDDWRRVITSIREVAPQLWQQMSPATRRRFVTHLRPYWDIHRHRIPQSTAAALRQLQEDGQLRVLAGRILAIESDRKALEVSYRPRGGHGVSTLHVDRIVNCTGPSYDITHTTERLLRGLLAQGLATPDALHLGIATDDTGRLVGADGSPARNLYYTGPLLRARNWESTAVAELRAQVARLARHLAGLRSQPDRDDRTAPGARLGSPRMPAHSATTA